MKASVNIGGLTGLAGILGSVNAQIQGAVSASSGLSAPSCLPEAAGQVASYKSAIGNISVSAQEIKTTIQDTISKWTSAESANMAVVANTTPYSAMTEKDLLALIILKSCGQHIR